MEAELMAAFAQFGVAGLIGWMWLSERRSTGERERQIDETHRRLMDQEHDRAALFGVVRDATRAMAAVEAGQRALASAIERCGCGGREGDGPCRGAA